MKTVFGLLVVMCLVSLSSCKKELMEDPTNVGKIRSELAAAPLLSKEEAQLFLEKGNLKSANIEDDATLVEIFPLDERTYEVYTNRAIRFFLYKEIDSNGNLRKEVTLSQIYNVRDGKVDLSEYGLDFQVGCPFNRDFQIVDGNNIIRIVYYLRFDDGRQVAYIADRINGGRVLLAPIAGCKYQLSVTYDSGNVIQEFNTRIIDYYNESNLINLKFDIKATNIASYLKINRDVTFGAYLVQIVGQDKDGNSNFINHFVSYDQSLPNDILISTPFDNISAIYVYGMNSCTGYEVQLYAVPVSGGNGKKYFTLK